MDAALRQDTKEEEIVRRPRESTQILMSLFMVYCKVVCLLYYVDAANVKIVLYFYKKIAKKKQKARRGGRALREDC